MSSGQRQEIFNPLERVVSSDMMRAQNFAQATLAEILRALFDTNLGTDDTLAGGAYLTNLVQASPVVGEIIGGLLFTPGVGTTGSIVGPGVVCVYDPDTSPSTDDSQYKVIQDPGSSSLVNASLAFTSNTTGSIRIDVVECSRVQPDSVIESDSRDVFNTVTGLFTAATVNKVTAAQMQYRIRLGTPGSGFPGTAQGWLPLAVASVPPGATTWSTPGALVTLWDVRPLIEDRIFGISNVSQDLPRRTKLLYSASSGTGSQYLVNGIIEATSGVQGRRVGGRMQRGSPGVDALGTVDFSDPANQEAGLSLAGANPALIYHYLCTPFGLPRWARYTDASSGALFPRSPRGIPLVSKVPPSHVYGLSTALITLPPVFGFDSEATPGVCVGATTYSGGLLNGATTSDGWTNPSIPINLVTATVPATTIAVGSNTDVLPQAVVYVASTAGFPSVGSFWVGGSQVFYTGKTGGGTPSFTGCTGGSATLATGNPVAATNGSLELLENTHYPAGATRLRLAFNLLLNLSSSAAGITTFQPIINIAEIGNTDTQFTIADIPSQSINTYYPSSLWEVLLTWVFEVELTNHYPNLSTGFPWLIVWELAFGVGTMPPGGAFTAASAQVLAWKYE